MLNRAIARGDLNTFLCLYRAKENNALNVNEAGGLHAGNVLKASSFVLACKRAVCVHSPYSPKSRGGSQIIPEKSANN